MIIIGWSIAIAYLLAKETRGIARRPRTTITKERGGRKRGRKRVRDKIAGNELSGPDASLMRTADIISGRDRNAIRAASLFPRRTLPVTGEAGGLLACHPFVFSRRSRDARVTVVFLHGRRAPVYYLIFCLRMRLGSSFLINSHACTVAMHESFDLLASLKLLRAIGCITRDTHSAFFVFRSSFHLERLVVVSRGRGTLPLFFPLSMTLDSVPSSRIFAHSSSHHASAISRARETACHSGGRGGGGGTRENRSFR